MTRILQITDPHLVAPGARALGRIDTATGLRHAVATLLDQLPRLAPVDAVVFTGDLTDLGEPEAYAQFLEIIAPLPLPWFAVPGNHDAREVMRQAFGGCDWMPASGPLHWWRDIGGLRLIGLDTHVPGGHHGSLSEDGVAFLGDALASAAGRPVLIALHHPPMTIGIDEMDRDNLRNAARIAPLIAGYEGELRLICGHVHRTIFGRFAGRDCVTSGASTHQVLLDLQPGAFHGYVFETGTMMLHDFGAAGFLSHMLAIGRHEGPYPFTPPEA